MNGPTKGPQHRKTAASEAAAFTACLPYGGAEPLSDPPPSPPQDLLVDCWSAIVYIILPYQRPDCLLTLRPPPFPP